ncbi:MAG: NADH-ubiquinone oxidoreductase-F iron-sulfur binding region domain-containing protein [Candidatus Woesearchaeota archaeon]
MVEKKKVRNVKRSSSKRDTIIKVCKSSGCKSLKSMKIIENLNEVAQRTGVECEIKETGCFGLCEAGPLVVVEPDETFYSHVKPSDAEDIISSLRQGEIIERLLYSPGDGSRIERMDEIDFYKYQTKYVLQRTGEIDPTDIKDFESKKGFEGLKKALSLSPDKIIEIVTESGLRGRGGGGFPTGKKWSFIAAKDSEIKYLVANADEGDPGSFMDRILLEGDPFAVIEGMLIAARAIGASHGIIYIRAEYPEAVEILEGVLAKSREMGYLGNDICGVKGFNFDITLSKGSGAFVCGEETALMNSVEGKRGTPRIKPPFPAEDGIHHNPTNINNVKTYAYVSHILRDGADSFNRFGTEKSPGTAVLSLTGKVNSTGIVEVPMGISLKSLIYDVGDGVKGGKRLKAVMTGGPSGGVIPASMLHLGVDYESLASVGSIMGSGGVLVFDETDSMPSIAKFFVGFTKSESCGKCVPCREGTLRLHELLQKFADGDATFDDLEFIERLCYYIKDTAACGLGQAAPNPVLTTLKYFRNEYEALIKGEEPVMEDIESGHKKDVPKDETQKDDKSAEKSSATPEESDNPENSASTDEIIPYFITDRCTGCGQCVDVCPNGCITGEDGSLHVIDETKCSGCGSCAEVCPSEAIKQR